MAHSSLIIIGAGIAGLAAGCYGQMNGFRSQIFEMHDLPGGLCTAWERQGYTFDGCIHYLFGSAAGQPFHQIWQELGAVQGRAFFHHEELLRVVGPKGKRLIVYCDPDRLVEQMTALSPEDGAQSEALGAAIRRFADFDMTLMQEVPRALLGPSGWMALGLEMMPFMKPLAQWGLTSAREFAERFHDPFLRAAIPQMFGWEDIPMMVGLSLLAYMNQGNAGFPLGGSLDFARALERRYLALGGEIHYEAQVQRILVEGDRAVGVRLYDDREFHAETVISAADGRDTIYGLLGGAFVEREVAGRYDGHLPLHAQLQLSLGVARDLSEEPHWTIYLLDHPIEIGGATHAAIGVKHYSFDPSLAPSGHAVVEVLLRVPYGYWQRMSGRRRYRNEKAQVCRQLRDFLESVYPGIGAQVVVDDVATPLTYERYTGNWQGSTVGWLLTDQTMTLMIQGMDKSLPGLKNFYMAGQWVEPGGSVPVVAMSGRNAIQLLCHAQGREFVSTLAEA